MHDDTSAGDDRRSVRSGGATTMARPAAAQARSPGSPPAVAVEAVTRSFGGTEVLRGIDLEVAAGTVLALLGPNGAGKTTLVRILTTLLRPDGGRATVAGFDVVRQPADVRRAISLTGQEVAVDGLLTGRENLVLLGRLLGLGRIAARHRADELLERLDLTAAARRPVRTWSGGMRRRLDLALSLLAEPIVLFLDEPTTGLDPAARATIWTMVGSLVDAGTTVVLTTQYLDEADQVADQVAVLADGAVVARGTPDELKAGFPSGLVTIGFADDSTWERARRVLDGSVDRVDRVRRTVAVATDGRPATVGHLLGRLEDGGVDAAELRLDRPSLDDVFLHLTGTAPAGPDPERPTHRQEAGR
jgi:ABC-2 type transport system ATP-binding protein